MEALHLYVHLTEAAELIHRRGVSHVVVPGVGETGREQRNAPATVALEHLQPR